MENKNELTEEEMTERELDHDIERECLSGFAKFGSFNSDHELYAVLLEELDEFWDEIKKNGSSCRKIEELIQIAAVARRGAIELAAKEQR